MKKLILLIALLMASLADAASVQLNWNAATDNVGVANYLVEQQTGCTGAFSLIGSPAGTSLLVPNLANSTQYCFQVAARDAANNVGQFSAIASATTPAPPVGTAVLGIGPGHYTINGVPKFLQCFSYYDISNYRTSDFDALATDGFNCVIGHADDVLRNNANSAYNNDGTVRGGKATAVNNAAAYLATKGMVLILNCLYADVDGTNSAAYLTTAQSRTDAIFNCVNTWKGNSNIGFSLVNEHNYGSFADTHTEMSAFYATARSACASCLMWFSSSDNIGVAPSGGHIWTPKSGTTVNTTNVTEELGLGINTIAPHDDRDTGWQNRITATYSNLRAWMNANGYQNVPILMDEPAREGSGGLGEANAYFAAFLAAKNAGAAGIDFHTDAAFDVFTSSAISQLTPVEQQVVDGLAAVLNSGTPSSVAFRQSASGVDESSGTSATLTFSQATQTGNALLLCAFWKTNVTISSISGHGTWGDSGAGRLARPTDGYLQCQGAPNITGSSGSITVNFSGSATSIYLRAIEYTGVVTASMFDTDTATGTATSGAVIETSTALDASTSSGVAFAFAVSDSGGTASAGAGMTGRFLQPGIILEDLTYSSTLVNFTPSGSFSNDFTKAGMVAGLIKAASAPPPQTTPRITALTLTASGATYTHIGSLASVRFQTPAGSTIYTIAQTPGGVITRPWSQADCEGTDCWVCLFAIDAAGVENTNPLDYRCGDSTAFIPTTDPNPPVASAVFPVGLTLAAGTTSQIISLQTNKAATCRWDTIDQAYALMPSANQFTTTGNLSHSTSLSGLVNNTAYTRYSRCSSSFGVPQTSSNVHTFTVEAGPATDTTPPSTVANLAGTVVSSTQITWSWAAATDANGIAVYKVFACTNPDCSVRTLLTTRTTTSYPDTGLIPGATYYRAVTAVDTFGNESVALSNIASQTTPPPTNPTEDTIPPTRVTGCSAAVGGPGEIVITCDRATDLVGVTSYIFEWCLGASCSDWTVLGSSATPTFTHTGRSNNQILNYRVKASDGAGNVSARYSPRLTVMTSATGWTVVEGACSCRPKQRR